MRYSQWAPLITKLSLFTPQLLLQLLPLLDHLPGVVAPVLQDQLGVDALSEGLSAALEPVGRALGHTHGHIGNVMADTAGLSGHCGQ